MVKLKELAQSAPVPRSIYKRLRDVYAHYQLRSKSTEQVFTEIYNSNTWNGKYSVSGPGSDDWQTRIIAKELPLVFRDLHIATIMDIPCGDFHWMKTVDLTGIRYVGADIVSDLINKNLSHYMKAGVDFRKMDLLKDKLPKMDLIFSRDCLVHFSFEDVFKALNTICSSGSEYLVATTFTGRKTNRDIATGQWRALNLEAAPFKLPAPLKLINEGCTEDSGFYSGKSRGIYSDKSLGLWRISDIREILPRE